MRQKCPVCKEGFLLSLCYPKSDLKWIEDEERDGSDFKKAQMSNVKKPGFFFVFFFQF